MSTPLRASARLAGLLGLEAAALWVLLTRRPAVPSVDWAHLDRWLGTTSPEDAVTAVVRAGAIAVAGWLLVTTALYLMARLTRIPTLVGGVEWVTLPAVRKVVDAAVAASVLGGAVFAGPAAHGQATTPAPIVVDLRTTTTTAPAHLYVPIPAGDAMPTTTAILVPRRPSVSAPAPPTTRPTPAAMPAAQETEHTHTVVPGDNLWTIAAAELSRQTGRTPDHLAEAEIRRYWLQVIDANRARLRSGDPNLIFPGESIICPPSI